MNTSESLLSRRSFVKATGLGALALASGGALVPLTGCDMSTRLAETVGATCIVTDDVGREVEIPVPETLERVYFTSALAQIFVYTVDPDLLAGTAQRYTTEQLDYLPVGTENLTYMGALSSGGQIDTEALLYHDIQLIFSISGTDLTDINISDAVDLQNKTGIPCVLIDGSFNIIGDTYRFLGKCLGREERANELAEYLEDIYRRVSEAVSRVPEEERVTYYYAEGPEGLSTEPDASQHSLAFQVAGGKNVVPESTLARAGGGMSEVSLESVIAWDPEFIITWDYELRGGAENIIRESPDWSNVNAVKNNRVYAMPNLPFAWCDRPPGVNRFLGIQWLANLFYPDYYDVDMVDVTREFYAKCYWRDITVEQAKEILGASYQGPQ